MVKQYQQEQALSIKRRINSLYNDNNHVISGGDSAKVIFSDGTSADTQILGGETYSDIAVLTVSAASIKQVATLGNTDK